MSSARSEADLLSALRELVQENAESVLGLPAEQLELERLSLSRPLRRKHNRHHRALSVRYRSTGGRREMRIWLKFVTYVRSRYDVHVTAWHQTRDRGLFPRPYFYAEWNGDGVIGMELVEGASLRDLFLRNALGRRSAALGTVFAALGTALRAFHDSSQPTGFRPMSDLEENVRRLAKSTEHLTRDERERTLESIACAAVRAGAGRTRLPSIRVHHDCTLRNVVVRDDGSPCLVDLDSMRAPPKSRWYDVVGFLINLESQIKYAPLGDPRAIAAAWRSFWSGYLGAGLPDGLSLEQIDAVLFLIKVEYLLGGTWRPLYEIYTGFPSARYIRRLKASLLDGEYLILASDARDAA
jgi:hypothetical protein